MNKFLLVCLAVFIMFGCLRTYSAEVTKEIAGCKEQPELMALNYSNGSTYGYAFPRADCLRGIAELRNDSSICEEINFTLRTGDVRNDCYNYVAMANHDPSRCRQGGRSYGGCVAYASGYNETYCENLSVSEASDGCFFEIGSCSPGRVGKCDLCSRIVNESYRSWCDRYCEDFC
jgi:hypothetical protein